MLTIRGDMVAECRDIDTNFTSAFPRQPVSPPHVIGFSGSLNSHFMHSRGKVMDVDNDKQTASQLAMHLQNRRLER